MAYLKHFLFSKKKENNSNKPVFFNLFSLLIQINKFRIDIIIAVIIDFKESLAAFLVTPPTYNNGAGLTTVNAIVADVCVSVVGSGSILFV